MPRVTLLLVLTCACWGCHHGPRAEVTCPPCECQCACEAIPVATDDVREIIGDLIASASRKMMHEDGAGCLTDLNRVKELAPQLDDRLAVTRGQCEMLTGKCAEGKARITVWYERELAMTPDRAEKTAEALASMRCRGGNSTPRDRLLVALQDLSDGAYMNKRSAAFCAERIAIVRKFGPMVKPRDAENTTISGGLQALFHTGAMCLARAGDCAEAYRVFKKGFEDKGLENLPTEEAREKFIREAFQSNIPLCRDNP